MKRKASISHDEAIIRRLRKDPDFAAEYLKAALEDEDEPRVLLIALRHLAQAQGIAKVAKAAGIERESLYRALSVHGNPRLSTLVAVTKAIGLRLTVEATEQPEVAVHRVGKRQLRTPWKVPIAIWETRNDPRSGFGRKAEAADLAAFPQA